MAGVPRQYLVVEEILRELKIEAYEPSVVQYVMDFVYNYISTVLEDARVYSDHCSKKCIDIEDLKLAVGLSLDKNHSTPPKKEFLMRLAKEKNSQPLPIIPENRCGVRLPPDRYCLTNSNLFVKQPQKMMPEQMYPRFGSYMKPEPAMAAPMAQPSYQSFTEQLQSAEPPSGFMPQQHTYGGNVYASMKRKREVDEYDDYDI